MYIVLTEDKHLGPIRCIDRIREKKIDGGENYMKLMKENDEKNKQTNKKPAQIVDVHFHLEEDNQEDK